jgi:uncharacterized protein YjhX (UPF0386 family)
MNISKFEQRTLHALARGGLIQVEKDDKGKICTVTCVTREGWVLTDCSLATFRRLGGRRLIASHAGSPYRITRDGLHAVRAQLDNR